MIRREWLNIDKGCQYYYQVHDGRIVGQVYNLAHTSVWGAKIPVTATDYQMLGNFIEIEYAKKAVEKHWYLKDRTYDARMGSDTKQLTADIVDGQTKE
jgi:hypothetical protein